MLIGWVDYSGPQAMYPIGSFNRTPTNLVISTRYCYDAKNYAIVVHAHVFGYSLELVDLQQELNIASSRGQDGCLIAMFGSDDCLRWPKSGSLRIF